MNLVQCKKVGKLNFFEIIPSFNSCFWKRSKHSAQPLGKYELHSRKENPGGSNKRRVVNQIPLIMCASG